MEKKLPTHGKQGLFLRRCSDRTYQAGGEEVTILGYDVSEWRRSYQHTVNKAGGEEVTILGYDVSEWRRSYQHTVNKVCSCEGVVIGLIRPKKPPTHEKQGLFLRRSRRHVTAMSRALTPTLHDTCTTFSVRASYPVQSVQWMVGQRCEVAFAISKDAKGASNT
ncbi:hypothetical protein J6590_057548 [Homalodisca vitripennis]|nr:hypothetical protein J6590_057548 [Homalodisca vitripennis]